MGEPTRHNGKFWWLTYLVLILLALIYISLFLIQIVNSFKTEAAAVQDPLGLDSACFTTTSYEKLFAASDFPLWVKNSFIVTLVVTVGRVFFNSLAGYALARLRFRGRNVILAALVAVMAVPNVVLLIPKFLVIKQLGIYDTCVAMTLPLLVDAAGIFIMKNFFESIPASVEEQA